MSLAKLSREDKTIAIQRIVWRMTNIDIGAAVHMDRRTVARRMEKVILPELQRVLPKYQPTMIKAGA